MEISFYPKRPKAKTETTLFARISYEGYQIKYYIPEKINPKFWNKETQRAKETQRFREHPEFNTRLNNILADCNNVYRKYVNDKGIIPNPETFKVLLDKEIKKKEPEKEKLKNLFWIF